MKLENGEIISDMKQVNKEVESFYRNLLETVIFSTDFDDEYNIFVRGFRLIPQFSLEESTAASSNLTLLELENVLTETLNVG